MPSLEWNRLWQSDLRKFREKDPGELYGMQWSDPEVRGLRYWIQRLLHPSYGPGPVYKVVDSTCAPTSKPPPRCSNSDPAEDGGRATGGSLIAGFLVN